MMERGAPNQEAGWEVLEEVALVVLAASRS